MGFLETAIAVSPDCPGAVCRITSQVSWLIALSLFCLMANAQQPEPRPTVTRATDLVLEYPSRVPLGTDVVFKRKTSATGMALVQAGVQVRVFRLDEGDARPKALTSVGDCEVYLTKVYPLERSSDGGLRFVSLNQGWINLSNSGRSTKDTGWFLVFEQVGAQHEQFRIKTIDAPAYFATGFAVTVFDNGSIPFPLIQAEYESRQRRAVSLYEEVDAKDGRVPCYSYKQLRVSLETQDLLAFGDVDRCLSADLDAM
jgi:hypothetical protein